MYGTGGFPPADTISLFSGKPQLQTPWTVRQSHCSGSHQQRERRGPVTCRVIRVAQAAPRGSRYVSVSIINPLTFGGFITEL